MNPLRWFDSGRRFLSVLFHQWNVFNVPRLAASLAYYATMSLAPMMVILMAVVNWVFGQEAAQHRLLEEICDQAGPQTAKVVQDLLPHIAGQPRGMIASIAGAIVILFGASGVFMELRDDLNNIWKTRPAEPPDWKSAVVNRLKGFAMVLGTGLCLTFLMLVGAVAAATGKFIEQWNPQIDRLVKFTDPIISLVLTTVLFALVYRFVPERTISWRHDLTGAFTTAVLFVAGKLAIGLYIGRAGVGSVFGAAGSVIALLAWIYYCSQVFLIGAIITHMQSQKERVSTHRPRPEFVPRQRPQLNS